MEPDVLRILERRVEGRHGPQPEVEDARRLRVTRHRQHVATPRRDLAELRHVQGQALPRATLRGLAEEALHAPDVADLVSRDALDAIAEAHPAVDRNAGHHRAEARPREGALDGHAKHARPPLALQFADARHKGVVELREAVEGLRRDRADRRPVEKGAAQEGGDLAAPRLHPVGRDQVDLGQRHEAVPDAEQLHDLHMLDRLRHDAVVGGDDQDRQVDARYAGDHVADELLVAGHIDDPRAEVPAEEARGEAEFDGEAALHLLLQAAGHAPGEHLDQARLAVVHVPRRAEHHDHLRLLRRSQESWGKTGHGREGGRVRCSGFRAQIPGSGFKCRVSVFWLRFQVSGFRFQSPCCFIRGSGWWGHRLVGSGINIQVSSSGSLSWVPARHPRGTQGMPCSFSRGTSIAYTTNGMITASNAMRSPTASASRPITHGMIMQPVLPAAERIPKSDPPP